MMIKAGKVQERMQHIRNDILLNIQAMNKEDDTANLIEFAKYIPMGGYMQKKSRVLGAYMSYLKESQGDFVSIDGACGKIDVFPLDTDYSQNIIRLIRGGIPYNNINSDVLITCTHDGRVSWVCEYYADGTFWDCSSLMSLRRIDEIETVLLDTMGFNATILDALLKDNEERIKNDEWEV